MAHQHFLKLFNRSTERVSFNVIKEIVYDPFGGIIEDTNPAFRIPLGFAGGLHDRIWVSSASAGATTTSRPADGPRLIP
ncbi:hypothetical protein [Pseudodesulfovibrio indicus]|uniref:Teneurin-like YD-shell domain-containing protein n=1 Tax=Pseudodesulfovibrio indicus TaxID=1716143 RepID=A0A126QLH6_9BACT|nr:hypothetical protein [Pseudodesulfovibrio indicus]AMK10646.1 hypothetical protein AWY79_05730 [Pseudodesulfovibrio indicus]TDT91618.1 hypothetical protein EDC59_10115 [Pseudodesulfovibrio indicus]